MCLCLAVKLPECNIGSSDDCEELEVDKYLDSFYDTESTESEYDADTELSDDETLSYQAPA